MSLYSLLSPKGSNGFGYGSTAEEVTADQVVPAVMTDPLDVSAEMEEVTQLSPEPTQPPLVSDPAIEEAAESTEAELGSDTPEPRAI